MENYKFINKIGKGTHGTTYLLRSTQLNQNVVCKSIGCKHIKHAKREMNILSMCDHKRIIKMYDSLKVINNIYLILEYANYGTLDTMIKYYKKNNIKPNISTLWSIAAQISDALFYLHSKNIIHRDIKPANILINKRNFDKNEFLEFKICDFSLSIQTEERVTNKVTVGTPYYMAPELIQKKPYDYKVDIWALGVILYEFANLERPFNGQTRESLYKKISNSNINLEQINTGDKTLDKIIYKCLTKSTERISSSDLAKNEKVRLILTTIELREKEERVKELEKKVSELQNE